MPKTNVIKLSSCPPADVLDDPMILCAISPHFEDNFSYRHQQQTDSWFIEVRSSSVDGLISFLSQCKRAIPAFGRGAAK